MKRLRLLLINFCVLIGLLLIVSIITYFIAAHRIQSFFEMTGPNQVAYLQKDSLAMFVHIPDIKIYDNWGTPQQKLTTERRTNNLGFREDDDIVEKQQNEYRILVTGDSHTDGVLKHNPQSFVNVWEEKLNASDSISYYNCINGGVGYYTFRNYLGFLKKYKHLKPNMYVINVFTGNDFREAPIFEDDRTNVANVFKNTYTRLKKRFYSAEKKAIPFTQGIEQTLYFYSFPGEKEKSLNLAKKYMLKIKELCAQENIQLVVTLLPSKIETNPAFKSKIQSLFNLDTSAIKANEKLTNEFIEWLNTEHIVNINLKAPLEQATEKVFWDEDLHINPKAHRIIGEFLFEKVLLSTLHKHHIQ
ncbi:SGNH/GDSL hydrolase family protein [Kordia sp. YSTF-M3]|uniref:SGNH/GDSL hydrolase family protein n=1 Tax=Kordia aestuariivivens TaxID=2759037 RepID=A0ABR7QGB9_9FLAO|nr:SGNH/GDSL hydrolase family protein [Kordia aestuariivivens]MBC8757584.1 SGNH/GDSL hydrolase family protein [Kordia aestuariivivens]